MNNQLIVYRMIKLFDKQLVSWKDIKSAKTFQNWGPSHLWSQSSTIMSAKISVLGLFLGESVSQSTFDPIVSYIIGKLWMRGIHNSSGKSIFNHPMKRQNFRDAPGQTFNFVTLIRFFVLNNASERSKRLHYVKVDHQQSKIFN